MKIYFLGNELVPEERKIFEVVKKLKEKIKGIEFVHISPEEVMKIKESKIYILDLCKGIKKC